MTYAPVVLFTFKRIDTLKQTIDSLLANPESKDTELFIFSDAARNDDEALLVSDVRSYIKEINGFKSVLIKYQDENKGLANSIISGVTEVFHDYEKVIVLEDDLLLSNNFLAYMNQSLDFYKENPQIGSISAYAFNFDLPDYPYDNYFFGRPWSWGWATWKDRWAEVDWEYLNNPNNFTKQDLKGFKSFGSDVRKMLNDQWTGKVNSWAIRFTLSQFIKQQKTSYPKVSKVQNIGFDQFATHTKGYNFRFIVTNDGSNLRNHKLLPKIISNNTINLKFRRKMSVANRILNKVVNLFK